MGWFSFQRQEGYPTHYEDQHSSASTDVLTAGLILAFLILGISLLSLLPSYNRRRRSIFFCRVVISLFIGGIVVVGNFGQNWEVGHVRITSPYKGGSPGEVNADLGIQIGLRGINITLNNANPSYTHCKGYFDHEDINYNEHFSWTWAQGRFGFGYYAAKIAREFREAVYRGVPLPILQLAEYFTFDGEGIRFGRHYRLAGWYAHILMWTAFPCWIISNVLFLVVIRYGALCLIATGWCQFIAIAVWYFTRNFVELQVPYESGHKEVLLKTHFGLDFYLVLFNSLFCLGLGAFIFFLNALWPDQMCEFFGIDPLTIYDEYHLTSEEIALEKKSRSTSMTRAEGDTDGMERGDGSDSDDSNSTDVVRRRSDDKGQLFLKRRTDVASRLFQKSFKVNSGILPRLKSNASRNPQGRVINEESEMSARTPLLAGFPSNDHYANVPSRIRQSSPGPNFPPPPPVVPPRSAKYSDH